MPIITGSWTYDVLVISLLTVFGVYYFFKRKFTHWEQLHVPVFETPSIPYGHFKGVKSTLPLGRIVANLYEKGKGAKVVGAYMFSSPILIVRDLELVKSILVKDFGTFHDRGIEFNTDRDPLGGHLFFMTGQKWRNLRAKLTPTFTSGKMRMMFPTILDVGKVLAEVLQQGTGTSEIDFKDILARYNTDVIASCAFGLDANSLKNPETQFRVLGKELSIPSPRQVIINLIVFAFPTLLKKIPLKLTIQHVEDFFMGVVRDTMKYREDNNVQRNDFLQLLLQLKNVGYVKDVDNPQQDAIQSGDVQKFTVEDATANAFIFYFAGFETSSSTMTFALYELALNPELQAKVQSEIDGIVRKDDNKLTYDGIQEMDLLDRIVAETLRKYPVADIVLRENNKEYKIPDTNITLPEKTKIWLPLYGIHHDEEYYPNPEKFDPDRFLPHEKEKRPHFAYLPFGEGPRSCIGNRFALMQTKVGLAVILSKFSLAPSKNTPIPIVFDPKANLLTPDGLVNLKLSARVK